MKFKKFVCEKEIINGIEFDVLPVNDAQILIQRRKELNMTQQQVAQAAGIHLRQYQRVESGECSFSGSSARIVLSVCEALQLDPYLFFGKGNEDTEDEVWDKLKEVYGVATVEILPDYNNVSMYGFSKIPSYGFC